MSDHTNEIVASHFVQSLPVMTIGDCPSREIPPRDESITTPLQAIAGVAVIVFVGWCIFYAPEFIRGMVS